MNILFSLLGTGNEPNSYGVSYYKKLLNLLIENNIVPMVTIYHFDMPLILADEGGIFSDSFVDWFANFSRILFREFGDYVKYWFTFNEPILYCRFKESGTLDYICAYNLLKSHGAAYQIYAKEFRLKQKGENNF